VIAIIVAAVPMTMQVPNERAMPFSISSQSASLILPARFSVQYFQVVPTYLFIPGGMLVILVVSFNLLGDAVRDALDPKAVH